MEMLHGFLSLSDLSHPNNSTILEWAPWDFIKRVSCWNTHVELGLFLVALITNSYTKVSI